MEYHGVGSCEDVNAIEYDKKFNLSLPYSNEVLGTFVFIF